MRKITKITDDGQGWIFTSGLTNPQGVKFEVVCTVSPDQYGEDFPELSEVTQMAIANIATILKRNERLKKVTLP